MSGEEKDILLVGDKSVRLASKTAVSTPIPNLVQKWLFSLDCAQTTQDTYRCGPERFISWLSSSWDGPVDATAVSRKV